MRKNYRSRGRSTTNSNNGRKKKRGNKLKTIIRSLPLFAVFLIAGRAFVSNVDAATPSVVISTDRSDVYTKIVDSTNIFTNDGPVEPVYITEANKENTTDDWKLTLVNPWNKLPEDYEITLTTLNNGHKVDERCYPDLQAMMDDCRSAGLSPVICSSYRPHEKQEQLFNNNVNKYLAQGYSAEGAKEKAGESVAVPGTSEHQLGLAVDIVDINNQNLNSEQENTAVQKWMIENSWKYGFILRYPSEKSEITGIMYEPWHYRYVGKDSAKEIYEEGICLEEYLDK